MDILAGANVFLLSVSDNLLKCPGFSPNKGMTAPCLGPGLGPGLGLGLGPSPSLGSGPGLGPRPSVGPGLGFK